MTTPTHHWEGRFQDQFGYMEDKGFIDMSAQYQDFKEFMRTEIEAAEKRERDRVDHIIRYLMDTKEFNTNEEFIACDDFAIEIIKRLSATKDKGEDVSSNNTV